MDELKEKGIECEAKYVLRIPIGTYGIQKQDFSTWEWNHYTSVEEADKKIADAKEHGLQIEPINAVLELNISASKEEGKKITLSNIIPIRNQNIKSY